MNRSGSFDPRSSVCLALLLVSALSAAGAERFLHVRVAKVQRSESSRIDIPVGMAAAILPGIDQGPLRGGKIQMGTGKINGVDLRAMLDATQMAPEGHFVTLKSGEQTVEVAKSRGRLLIDAREGGQQHAIAHLQVPLPVVQALLSAGKDQLDLVAALKALEKAGDTELVQIEDPHETIRIWVDGNAGQ